jgi:uncharacterized protein (TIRG00374 family)
MFTQPTHSPSQKTFRNNVGANRVAPTGGGGLKETSRRRLRWVRRVVGVAVIVAGLIAAWSRRHELGQAINQFDHLDWPWLVVAIVLEMVSVVVLARLESGLLACGGLRIRLGTMMRIALASNSMAVSLPGGAVVAGTWSYGQLRRRGANRVLAGWVVLVAGALESFALFVVLATGAIVAGGDGPAASLRWLAVALASIPVGFALVAAAFHWIRPVRQVLVRLVHRWQHRPRLGRVVALMRRFVAKLRVVQLSPFAWLEAFGLALLNWLLNLGCLITCIYAVGGHPPWRGLLVAYGAGQLLASLPITPGGLAVVEGGLTALLFAYGMPAQTALAAVLLYRVISFWALVPIGWASYGLLAAEERRRHSITRWEWQRRRR